MARGAALASPAAHLSLPKVEFEIIEDDALKLPGGVKSDAKNQAKTFGYNDFSLFQRPDHYIRHIEPLESDLAKTVEYDMDEQDQEWLDAVNADRKRSNIGTISCESFEIIMDRLEKEWFELTKNIPKPDFAMPSEDSTCAICDDSEGENSNAIVFCDGCNLAVHQDCYGVPYIPEGQWLCRKCTVSPEVPVYCDLCPNEGGAFKQTVTGEWVHLLCAIWIPETRVANDVFMEPITGVDRISKQRRKLRCTICHRKDGACIQCSKPSCFVAFHATCGRKAKLLMPMKSAQGAEPASLTCFCDRHLPPEQQEARAAAFSVDDSRNRSGPGAQITSKTARAYAKTYKQGPPLMPAIAISRIVTYTARIDMRKKQEFIQQMARYWSLKREVRRGAPLLKRLHLEPWTANAGVKVLSDQEKLMRLDQLERLKKDLEYLQALTLLCRKREIKKYRQAEVIRDVLNKGLFPHLLPMRQALKQIMDLDRPGQYFKYPVLKQEVPDYFDIIEHPMCWTDIEAKLEGHKYWDLQSFKDDIHLVLDNAVKYNKSETVFYKSAMRIRRDMEPILSGLDYLKASESTTSNHIEDTGHQDSLPQIGDLEPALDILDLLLSSNAIKDDLNMELDHDPITSLLNYELAKQKPLPHEPSPPVAVTSRHQLVLPASPSDGHNDKLDDVIPNQQPQEDAIGYMYMEIAHDAPTQTVFEEPVVPVEMPVGESHPQESIVGEEPLQENDEQQQARLAKQRDRRLQEDLDASAGFRAPSRRSSRGPPTSIDLEDKALTVSSGAGPSTSEQTSISAKKRPPVTPTPQTSVPRVVDDVDNRDSFNMFNVGWILPPDHKRHGRAPTDRHTVQPPKKRQKTDHASLSAVSAASDNYNPRKTPPWSSDVPGSKSMDDVSMAMDVDVERDRMYTSHIGDHSGISHAGEDTLDEPLNVVTQPNGVVIIEKLDTPAIRREKAIRRKAEKQKQANRAAEEGMAAISASSSIASIKKDSPPPQAPPTPPPPPPPPSLPTEPQVLPSSAEEQTTDVNLPDHAFEEESELSELSSSSITHSPPASPVKSLPSPPPPPLLSASNKGKGKPKKPAQPKNTRPSRKEQFPEGTIVWAKTESYPWWPAVVYSESDPMIPKSVLLAAKEKRQKRKGKLYIIQFYDKQHSWQSVTKDKLQELGEDKKVDEDMLTSNQKQKWKPSASKQQCREAYMLALSEIDHEASALPKALSNGDEDADADGESDS